MKKSTTDKTLNWIMTAVLLLMVGMIIYALVTQEETENKLFNFLRDVVPIVASGATLVLAWAAFHSIRENRRISDEDLRRRALERIRNWAEELFGLVTRPTRHRQIEARKIELDGLLHLSGAKSVGVLKDAELTSNELWLSVNLAHAIIFKFNARLRGEEAIVEFKGKFGITDGIKQIENTKELEEQKEELLAVLTTVINSVTEQLVIPQ